MYKRECLGRGEKKAADVITRMLLGGGQLLLYFLRELTSGSSCRREYFAVL